MNHLKNDLLRFIRVQEELHDMRSDSEGNLTVVYDDSKERNTIHFSVNSIVEDHSYGKFNYDSHGNFKGKVVIIADPEEMMVPTALNQVDTWFRYGIDKQTQEKVLDIGKAVLVIPEGMIAPDNANVLRYDGTEKHRNEVVEQHLNSLNIERQYCLMRNWTGEDLSSSIKWSEEVIKKNYPGEDIFIGMHDGSIDSKLESGSMKAYLNYLKNGERYHAEDSGVETLIVEKIEKRNTVKIERLQNFINELNPQEKERIGEYYEKKIVEALSEIKEAKTLDATIRYDLDIKSLREEINKYPGEGLFYIAKPGATTPIMLTNNQFHEMIVTQELKNEDRIWRSGYKSDWEPLGKSKLKDYIESISKPESTQDSSIRVEAPSLVSVENILENTKPQNVLGNIQKFRSKLQEDLPQKTLSTTLRYN